MAQPTGLDRNPQAYAIAEYNVHKCGQYETCKHQLITPQAMGKQASTWQHLA